MAEAFLNRLAGDRFEAESAGIEPGGSTPEAMREISMDIVILADPRMTCYT